MVDSKTHLSTSLKIRSNKHRCFLFCHEHSSLTCVPGIGKKNKQLLNQSGVYDLAGLFQKYREMKNIQHFKDWLNNRIGFTKYQARMAACGISTKIGETKEIDTGLISLGSLNERSEENQSIDDIKKHQAKTRNTRCRSHRRFLKIVKDMKQIELQTKSSSIITDFPDRTPLKNTEISEKFNPFQWIKQEVCLLERQDFEVYNSFLFFYSIVDDFLSLTFILNSLVWFDLNSCLNLTIKFPFRAIGLVENNVTLGESERFSFVDFTRQKYRGQ